MASRDRDRIAATAAGGARCRAHARHPPCRWTGPLAQVPARETIIPSWLGVRAGLGGCGERVPAVAAEGQHRPAGVFAVADLDGAGAGMARFDAVASVGVGVAALGPVGGERHQILSFYRSLIASPMRERDSAGLSEAAR